MNILVVHEKNWRAKNVFELQSYAESLSLKGHNVHAIEYDEVWERKGFLDILSLKTQKFQGIHRAFDNASVTLWRPGTVKLRGVSRLVAGLTFCQVFTQVVKQENINVVLMYSVPTYGVQTSLLAKWFNIPVLFRAIDIPTELVPNQSLRLPTLLLEKIIYPQIDKTLALTPKLKEYIMSFGVPEDKVALLLPSVNANRFFPNSPANDLMQKWGISPDDKVVLHMGRAYSFSGLDKVIEYFGAVLAKEPRAKLLLVGGGEELHNLQQQAKHLPYNEKIIFTGYQPFELMPAFINLSHICTIPFEICDATVDIIPSKSLEYLACGKPVVSNRLPGMLEILPDEQCGMFYADNETEFTENIIALLTDHQLYDRLSQHGIEYIHECFSWAKTINELEQSFETVIRDRLS